MTATSLGELRTQSGTAPADNDFLFAGEPWDSETGNYYLRARYLDPGTGRFLVQDPAGSGSSPYPYAGNNPLRYTDPLGLDPETPFDGGSGPCPACMKSPPGYTPGEWTAVAHPSGGGVSRGGWQVLSEGTDPAAIAEDLLRAMESAVSLGFLLSPSLQATDAGGFAAGLDELRRSPNGTLRFGPEGTIIFENLAGPLAALLKGSMGGKDTAITIGHVILNTTSFSGDAVWLAHEVGHVRQAEVLGSGYIGKYLVYQATFGYQNNPMEIAARNFAERHWSAYVGW